MRGRLDRVERELWAIQDVVAGEMADAALEKYCRVCAGLAGEDETGEVVRLFADLVEFMAERQEGEFVGGLTVEATRRYLVTRSPALPARVIDDVLAALGLQEV
jgi:hypothetical protein